MGNPSTLLHLSAYSIVRNNCIDISELCDLPLPCQEAITIYTNMKRGVYEKIARLTHEVEDSWQRYTFFLKLPNFIMHEEIHLFMVYPFFDFVTRNGYLARKYEAKHMEALRQKQSIISLLKIVFCEDPNPKELAYHKIEMNFSQDLFLELYNNEFSYFHYLVTKKPILFMRNTQVWDIITSLEEIFKDFESKAVVDEFYMMF